MIKPTLSVSYFFSPYNVKIGSDGGFMEEPVPVESLTMGVSERADIIIDFAGMEGQELILRNNAPVPFPVGM